MITSVDQFNIQVQERLIKSYPIDQTMYLIKHRLCSILDQSKINIEQKFNNTIELSILDPNKDILDYIGLELNVFGWYPSFVTMHKGPMIKNVKFDYNQIIRDIDYLSLLIIVLESKFDNKVQHKLEYLYHITDIRNIDKINKNGLIPKAKNKASVHPERVYFIQDLNNCQKLLSRFESDDRMSGKHRIYKILKIKNDNLDLYVDPNLINGGGFYCYDNINPSNIQIINIPK